MNCVVVTTIHRFFQLRRPPFAQLRSEPSAPPPPFFFSQPASTPEERSFEAMLDGNSLLSDGPLAAFTLDAEGRYDASQRQEATQAVR